MNARLRGIRFGAAALATLALVSLTGLASAQDANDLSWPRQLDGEMGQIIIYQPQFQEYSGDSVKARAAVSVTPTGQTEPVFGAVWFDARLATDRDARTASLESIVVTDVRFPGSKTEEAQRLADYLEEEIPKWEMVLSLDRLAAGLEPLEGAAGSVSDLKNEPPKIIYTSEPTVLVTIDGDPIMADLEGSHLKYIVNTPFYILQEPGTGGYYLTGGGHWYTADDVLGEWQLASSLPPDVSAVADQVEREEQKRAEEAAADPSTADPAADLAEGTPPRIIVSTTPAEVIETDGEPLFAPIQGTDLLYLQNSESDVIMDIPTQRYFILLAGRWYTSDSLSDGKWVFVAPDGLPADFARIPADSEMADVRASVAGTEEAADAVAENVIPQTAEVDRHTASVTVTYDGDPEFIRCSNDVAYAANADKAVLLVDDVYYCCDDAVWFVSRAPYGPWVVATEVPAGIYDIPPSCPFYNVRYVYIYNYTPDIIYVGYTPGYFGSYIYRGCVVYGTGYWYHPWYRHHYYPRFATWGYGAHWRPYTGWGFYFGVSFGWLDVWFGRPWYTGWWGPCGYVYGYRSGYHHGYHHGYHEGYHEGYHDGYWDSQFAGYHPPQHPGLIKGTDLRNVFVRRGNGIYRSGGEREPVVGEGGTPHVAIIEGVRPAAHATEHMTGTPVKPPKKEEAARQATVPVKPLASTETQAPTKYESRVGTKTPTEVKKPKTTSRANDVYAAPDGEVYQEKGGTWQKVDKSRRISPAPAQPPKPTRNELNKEQKVRSRGAELEKKSKPRTQPTKAAEPTPVKPSPQKRSDVGQPKGQESRPAPSSSKGAGKR
jgi:hypothetical protein